MPTIKGIYVDGVVYNYEDANIAPIFQFYKKYLVDDLVLHDGILYRCILSHTSNNYFDTKKWEPINLEEYLKNNFVSLLEGTSADFYSSKRPNRYDFSHVNSDGYFTERLENNKVFRYNVVKDSKGLIIKIVDASTGFETSIQWPENLNPYPSSGSGNYWFGSKAEYANLLNNGTIQNDMVYFIETDSIDTHIIIIEEPELPEEYEQLEYLNFTPPVGFLVSIPSSFFGYALVSFNDVPRNTDNCVFGYRISSSNNKDFEVRVQANTMNYLAWARSSTYLTYAGQKTITDNIPIKISFGFNDLREAAYIGGYGLSSGQEYGFDGKLYSLKGFTEPVLDDSNSTPLFDFIPCKRKSDNTLGFYEKISQTFYSTTMGNGYVEAPT